MEKRTIWPTLDSSKTNTPLLNQIESEENSLALALRLGLDMK